MKKGNNSPGNTANVVKIQTLVLGWGVGDSKVGPFLKVMAEALEVAECLGRAEIKAAGELQRPPREGLSLKMK